MFGKKCPDDFEYNLWMENFFKIALSHTVSKINAFLCFTLKFKRPIKWREMSEKKCQMTLNITCGSKISSKLLYHTPFLR